MNTITLLLGCILLSLIATGGIKEALEVIQTPHRITVKDGDSVNISCCWRGCFTRARIKWMKNTEKDVIVSKLISSFSNNTYDTANYEAHVTNNCSILTILKVTMNDSGSYHCAVITEIPSLKIRNGTGTEVEVQPFGHNIVGSAGSWPVGMLLPLAAAVVALCLIAAFCQWRRKRAKPLSFQSDWPGRVGMVIREAPHGGQEELEQMNEMAEAGDRSSGSSRGSTEWRPVQLYESVDYFSVQNNA